MTTTDVENQTTEEAKPTKRDNDGEDNNNMNSNQSRNDDDDDDDDIFDSCFEDEGKMGYIWIGFVAVYWTLTTWITILVTREFEFTIIPWCLGLICLVAVTLMIRRGSFPSGATKQDPKARTGKGRWAMFGTVAVMTIDLIVLVFYGMNNGANLGDLFRGLGHFVGLLWATLFFYNRFEKANPEIATQAFCLEWADVLLTIIVIWVLNFDVYDSKRQEGCFNHRICGVYGVFVILQLCGWVWPMMLIEGWGSKPGAPQVAIHLMLLDICTDLPVVITILSVPNISYKAHWIIFVDVICKTLGLIRSLSYYSVFYIWLKQGKIWPTKTEEKPLTSSDNDEVR